jgi:flavin reductase (DIM6/NTAB) family NADH-FMN oxidoreductase RutF
VTPVAPGDFRETLKKFASGVTIITTAHEGEMHGLTASSFASVSVDPPLILVVLNTESRTYSLLKQSNAFNVSILGEEHRNVARAFAEKGAKPFDSLPHHAADNGAPILDEAIGWLECSVEATFPGGTHEVVLGRVEASGSREGRPLVYFERDYRSLNE